MLPGPVLEKLGLDGLGSYRGAQIAGPLTAWRVAPDKMLIEGSGDLSAFRSDDLAVLDLSHSRVVITVSGPAAETCLAQMVPVDLSQRAFQPGDFIQTGMHHVGALIQGREINEFDVYVPVTWAESLLEFVEINAKPHGLGWQVAE